MASTSSLKNFFSTNRERKHYIVIIFISGAVVFVATLCLFVTLAILSGAIDPVRLGFFCNDHSIRYPFKHRATLPTWSMYITAVLAPIVTLTCGTLLDIKRICGGKHTAANEQKRPPMYCYLIKPLIWFFWYLIGIGLTNIITDAIKLSFGELRPYFLSVCDPDMSLVSCTDEFGWPKYVTNYTCRGDSAEVREARLSFPSGHASTGSFMLVFIALYISSLKIIHSRSPLQFLFITIIGVLLTMYVGVTRITDFRHHFRDVVAGTILGTLMALLVVYFNTYYFSHHYCNGDPYCIAHNKGTASCTRAECCPRDYGGAAGEEKYDKIMNTKLSNTDMSTDEDN